MDNTDPSQVLKAQLGELVWANSILTHQIQVLTAERDELKKKFDEK